MNRQHPTFNIEHSTSNGRIRTLPPSGGGRLACRRGRHLAARIRSTSSQPRQECGRGVRRAEPHGSTAGGTPAATAWTRWLCPDAPTSHRLEGASGANSPFKNLSVGSSRGNEAQISSTFLIKVRASSRRLLLFQRGAKGTVFDVECWMVLPCASRLGGRGCP
jgi:hypothetical protein